MVADDKLVLMIEEYRKKIGHIFIRLLTGNPVKQINVSGFLTNQEFIFSTYITQYKIELTKPL